MMKNYTTPIFLFLLTICLASSKPAFCQKNAATNISLDELDGTMSNLSDYLRAGPVYINFWALWCEPCKQELRALKTVAKNNEGKPFSILAVNLDSPKSLAKVKAYVRSQGYPFPVVLDPNMQVLQRFNGQNLPFAILLDGSGKVVTTRTGYLPGDENDIEGDILKLLR